MRATNKEASEGESRQSLPITLLKSLPEQCCDDIPLEQIKLDGDGWIKSEYHQNHNRQVFEGFYKAIIRKIGNG